MNRGIHVSVVVDALHAVTRGLEVARACHFAVIGVIGVTLPSSFLLPGYTLDSARAALFVAGAVSLVGLLLATQQGRRALRILRDGAANDVGSEDAEDMSYGDSEDEPER